MGKIEQDYKKLVDPPKAGEAVYPLDWFKETKRETLKVENVVEGLHQSLLADYDSACAVIQDLHIKKDSLEAKNADACNTISDLLAQMECLQVANRNLCARNETLQERVKNLEEVNTKHIENEDVLRIEKQIILEKRERARNALFETQVAILKLQRKVEKLKKKNKLLAKATLC